MTHGTPYLAALIIVDLVSAIPVTATGSGLAPIQLAQADLPGKVTYRMQSVSGALDGFEANTKLDYPKKRKLPLMKGALDSAEYAYKQIHDYYGGTFDPDHPDFAKLTKRLEAARAAYAAEESGKTAPATAAETPAGPEKLDGRVVNCLKKANASIDKVEKTAGNAGPGAAKVAEADLEAAEREHAAITEYYGGKFDPTHSDYVDSLNRLASARDLVAKLRTQETASPERPATRKPSAASSGTGSARLPGLVSVDIASADESLRSVMQYAEEGASAEFVQHGGDAERYGEDIKQRLANATNILQRIEKEQSGTFDPNHADWTAFLDRIDAGETAAETFYAFHGLYGRPPSQALLEAMKPTWEYPDQGMTSPVHERNLGGIVWSKVRIAFKAQEQAKLESTFSLADRIYGRIFLERSLGNTAVLSTVNSKPLGNQRGEFEYRLFIDEKPIAVSFGVFHQGSRSESPGRTGRPGN